MWRRVWNFGRMNIQSMETAQDLERRFNRSGLFSLESSRRGYRATREWHGFALFALETRLAARMAVTRFEFRTLFACHNSRVEMDGEPAAAFGGSPKTTLAASRRRS